MQEESKSSNLNQQQSLIAQIPSSMFGNSQSESNMQEEQQRDSSFNQGIEDVQKNFGGADFFKPQLGSESAHGDPQGLPS
mmetsp:Transcript_9488/g.15972  ORF Transcript_9488/g.15972 Transcript_9488/m.15972 type:complete len:80 (-) Transcript_9488:730-969(-)